MQRQISRETISTVPLSDQQTRMARPLPTVSSMRAIQTQSYCLSWASAGGVSLGRCFFQNAESQGFEVIVIDNRDTGGSDLFTDGYPHRVVANTQIRIGLQLTRPYTPTIWRAIDGARCRGSRASACYGCLDGRDDCAGAANFPSRIKTLTSVMSTTQNPLPPPSQQLRITSETWLAVMRRSTSRAHARTWISPESMERHLMAIFKTGDRTQEVQTITAPTLCFMVQRTF